MLVVCVCDLWRWFVVSLRDAPVMLKVNHCVCRCFVQRRDARPLKSIGKGLLLICFAQKFWKTLLTQQFWEGANSLIISRASGLAQSLSCTMHHRIYKITKIWKKTSDSLLSNRPNNLNVHCTLYNLNSAMISVRILKRLCVVLYSALRQPP